MTVKVAPLSVPHSSLRRALGRSWRPACEGGRIGRPHRWAIDGAIFRRVVRSSGGTVLIDTSGSMGFGAEHVDRIVEASRGAAIVAIYSGREREGELRIVARDGRRAAPQHLERYGVGNIIDLSALEWLARHAKPRIWVSDGSVTGVGDTSSSVLTRRCRLVTRLGEIRRVKSAEEAAEVFEGAIHTGANR